MFNCISEQVKCKDDDRVYDGLLCVGWVFLFRSSLILNDSQSYSDGQLAVYALLRPEDRRKSVLSLADQDIISFYVLIKAVVVFLECQMFRLKMVLRP